MLPLRGGIICSPTTITERYSHLYPSVQRNMADTLDKAFKAESEENNG